MIMHNACCSSIAQKLNTIEYIIHSLKEEIHKSDDVNSYELNIFELEEVVAKLMKTVELMDDKLIKRTK